MASDITGMSAAVGGMYKVTTVGGCDCTVSVRDAKVMMKDCVGTIATLIIAQVTQSNGVIPAIGTVLMPAL